MKMLALLLKYWKIVVSLSVILFALIAIHTWMERECTRREVALRQAYQKQLDEERTRSRAIERKWQTLVHEAEYANQERLQALEVKYRGAVERIGPVRLCPSTARAAASVSRDSAAAPVRDDPARSDGLPDGAANRDIGPDLIQRIARPADAQTARLIACQDYIRALETLRK